MRIAFMAHGIAFIAHIHPDLVENWANVDWNVDCELVLIFGDHIFNSAGTGNFFLGIVPLQ